MARVLLSVALAVLAITYGGTAFADGYWAQDGYGYVYWVDTGPDPDNVLFVGLLIAGLFVSAIVIFVMEEEKKKKALTAGLPAEIASPQTVEFYQDQTARVIEYDRYLRAQANQYRQYIETARLEAEAHEVAWLIEDQRRHQREGW